MKRAMIALTLALGLLGQAAAAEEFEVKMLNKGETGMMVFEPAFVRAQVGDTVHFIATDKGHNVETIPGMLPDGAAPVDGKTGQDYTLTVSQEGVWGLRCKPHYALGMVAMVVAGDPVNEDAAKAVKVPGKAKAKMHDLFEQLDAK